MPKKQVFKYEVGYKFFQYEIIDRISRPRPNSKNRYLYVLKCLNCGSIVEREECYIDRDIKCSKCKKLMMYSRFSVGDIINDLEILEKSPQITKRGHITRAYLCRCLKDGYVSVHTEHNLLKNKGCPVCAGNVIMRGVNDINTVAPWLGDLLENKEDGDRLGIGSKEKVRFRCPFCGTLTNKMDIYNVYTYGHVPCRKCGDGISMPEKLMYGLLEQFNIDFEYQKQFDWSRGRFYDFYIKDIDMIIETHGRQHFVPTKSTKWGSLEGIQKNDAFKKNVASENNISEYVVIDASKQDPIDLLTTYINVLSEYFVIHDVDLTSIVLNSCKSFCIKAGDLWNEGNHKVISISNILRLNERTIREYLRTLNKIGYLNISYPIKNNKI